MKAGRQAVWQAGSSFRAGNKPNARATAISKSASVMQPALLVPTVSVCDYG